ncbi:hypothetical protein VNI00_009360 [Paramarasmius palmivorus]|uniref:Protein kinase domain-containing protein n=1 Tax=Paramarasmius palmivorus TaxID=297713 RepID=A0AAW0CP39_9AGAR
MIIHGDIKGANILVDNSLSCCLADFGLAAVAGDTQLMNATTSGTLKGSLRWMAPEMFNMSIGTPTSGTIIDKSPRDVYAYACTILEIMTGRIPFPELMDPAVMFQVIRGARPSRPTEGCWCPDNIWNLVELCWQEDPGERPRAVQIETYLKKLLRSDQEDIVFSPEPSETLDAELHAHDDWVITGHNNSQGHKSDSDSDESSFDTVTSFFRAHTEELQRACHLPDPNIDIGSMDAEHAWDLIYVANNELDETAWVALEALECLAKLHSYRVIQMSDLVVACKHRIAPFYQTRSERWDVLALKIQIQMAMVQLFELRFIDDLESLGSAWIDLHSIFLQMTADLEHAAGFFQIGFDADPQAGCFDICRRFYLYQRILAEQLLPLTSSPKYTQDVTKTLHPFERATPYLHPWIDYSEVQRESIGLSLDFGYRHFKPVEVYRVGETLLIRDAPMDKLKEQATIHGLLSVTAIIDGMSQWPVEVQRQQHPISLQDLLSDVYDSLRRRIRPREYNALSKEDANEVAAAFYRRCDAYRAAFGDRRAEAEIADGLKRVDYLKGRSKLGWAIMENDNGRAVVRLTVEEGYIASY